MSKKSQLTIFIILAIVITFLFIVMIMVSENMQKNKSEQNYEKINQLAEDKKIIENYLKDCFENAVKINLMKIALQGGWYYDYQVESGKKYDSGKVVPFWYNNTQDIGQIHNISYAIQPRNAINDFEGYNISKPLYKPDKGYYPFGDKIGEENFPTLCYKQSANAAMMENAEFSCPVGYASSKNDTIQFLLEKKITEDTKICFNEQRFKQRINADLEMKDEEQSKTEVLFGEDNVYVQLYMPIKVEFNYQNLNEKPILNKDEFAVQIPVRFKHIHELMYWILQEDARNIFFNLNKAGEDNKSMHFCVDKTDQDNEVDCFREGMSFEIIKNGCEYTNDKYTSGLPCDENANKSTFFIVRDNKSYNLYNEPFMFVTVVGNRPPIVDLVNYHKFNNETKYYEYLIENYKIFNSGIETTPNKLYNRTKSPVLKSDEKYDVILDWDEELFIIPRAIDPDEDFEYKNSTTMKKFYFYSGWKAQDLMNSSFYKKGAVEKVIYEAIIGKDVNLTLNINDTGEHKINITVYDANSNYFVRGVNLQIRCFDQLRAFNISETKSVRLKNRRDDTGKFWPDNSQNLQGDYNFSALSYDDIDRNDSNDCCNESAGFINSDNGHKCDICHRCLYGNCLINVSVGNTDNDCGYCKSCGIDGNCVVNNSHNQSCINYYNGNGACCEGNCINLSNPTNLNEFTWTHPNYNGTKNNQSFSDCWEQSPSCVKLTDVQGFYDSLAGNYTYKPLSGITCTNYQGNVVLCSYGRCD
jgi:hypothetical protein